jgi:hypothetical protein
MRGTRDVKSGRSRTAQSTENRDLACILLIALNRDLPFRHRPISKRILNLTETRSEQQTQRPRNADRRRRQFGRGVAVVELALCLPILALLLFATIEACVMIQLKQNVTITAYEGARIGILPGSNTGLVQAQCQMLLEDRGISGYTITANPAPSGMALGDLLTVTVSADCVANSVVGGIFYEGKAISETIVMRAE